MKIKKTIIQSAFVLVAGTTAISSHAAVLNNGDILSINAGITAVDSNGYTTNVTASWFGIDTNVNGVLDGSEKWALSQGTTGIKIGATQTAGAIDAPGIFFGNSSVHHTASAITGDTVNGLDFSGWRWIFAGNDINMGSGAWGAGFTNGKANFVWDGVYGHAYTLDYAATIPARDPCGCAGQYRLHLEGNVNAVPVPAAFWLFGSGMVGLFGLIRRRKNCAWRNKA